MPELVQNNYQKESYGVACKKSHFLSLFVFLKTLFFSLSFILVLALVLIPAPHVFALDNGNLESDLFGGADALTSDNSEPRSGEGNLESDLFGGSSAEDDLFGGGDSAEDDFFSRGGGTSFKDLLSEKLDAKDAQFDIGGNYYHSLGFSAADSQETGQVALNSSGIVDLYFDAALEDSIRFFLKQKINQDFTEGGDDGTTGVDFSGPQAETSIDQLWLKFNYDNRLYMTMGKQPTSWGSGFVWAPTDFINAEAASPFSLSDQRLGVSLIKFQYPFDVQGINLYAVFQTSQAATIEDVKTLFRAEFLGRQSELALSFSTRANEQTQFGVDLSSGLGPVDVFVNLAVTRNDEGLYYEPPPGGAQLTSDDYIAIIQSGIDGSTPELPEDAALTVIDRSDESLKETSAGFIYLNSLEDDTQIILNGEIFYNDKGYDTSDFLTVYLLQNNFEYDPLYFSRKYAALGITRAGMGASKSISTGIQYIKNVSDSTGALVLTYSFRPFKDMSFSSNLVTLTGHDGTFRPFVNDAPELQETLDRISAGELVLPPGTDNPFETEDGEAAATVQGISFEVPRYTFSMQLSLSY